MGSGIHKVGVLGMGLMGSGIAQVAATRNFDTVVIDVSPQIVGKGMERIRDSLKRLVGSYRKSSGKTGIAPDEEENGSPRSSGLRYPHGSSYRRRAG